MSLSPQANHQLYGVSSELDDDKVVMHFKQQPDASIRCDIKIPIDHLHSNLPIISNTAFTKKELDMIRPHYKSAIDSFHCTLVFTDHWNWNMEVDKLEYEFDCYSNMCWR